MDITYFEFHKVAPAEPVVYGEVEQCEILMLVWRFQAERGLSTRA
jgi:hypothetical protein